ncbi:MAG: OmpH family outer membrane protein [Bacteroidota bacterium]
MKKSFIAIAACTLFTLAATTTAFAQLKIGHIDSEKVMALMPERDSAAKVFEKYSVDLNKVLDEMQTEFTNKADQYNLQKDSLSQFIRQAKEAELLELQKKIGEYQTLAQQELQKKQNELLAPIIDKVKKAIKDVAIANKYTYILDTAYGTVLYFPEDESMDVLPLVKAKLGIK